MKRIVVFDKTTNTISEVEDIIRNKEQIQIIINSNYNSVSEPGERPRIKYSASEEDLNSIFKHLNIAHN